MRRAENVFKRKDGRWEGRYANGKNKDGKTKYSSVYARTYKDCLKKLNYAKLNNNKNDNKITIERLFNEWLLSRKYSVKDSTYVNYITLYDNHIKNRFGDMDINQISAVMINQWISELFECGNTKTNAGLSSKSIQSILIMYKSIMKYGQDIYNFPNPIKNVCLPKIPYSEIKVFSKQEIMLIKQYMLDTDCLKLGILICLFSGLRIGEICALKWKDFDLENGVIHIRSTLQRIKNPNNDIPKTIIIVNSPKSNKSIRDIPIPEFVIPYLKVIIKNTYSEFYFLSNNHKPIEPRGYSEIYKGHLKKLNISYRNFHVLRHTFATECIKSGIDVKTVSELLGHANVNITLEKYVHSDMKTKQIQLKKLYAII